MTAEKKNKKIFKRESKTGHIYPNTTFTPLTSQFTVLSNKSSIVLQASQLLFYYQGPLWIF